MCINRIKCHHNSQNINEIDGWNYKINEKYRNEGGKCECRIILTNNDINSYISER